MCDVEAGLEQVVDLTGINGTKALASAATAVDPLDIFGKSVDQDLEKAAPVALSFVPGVGPALAAGYSAAADYGAGANLGNSLESGAETFAGSEIGGAAGSELGVGAGNSLSDILGSTEGAGSITNYLGGSATGGVNPLGATAAAGNTTSQIAAGLGGSPTLGAAAPSAASAGSILPASGFSDAATGAINSQLTPDLGATGGTNLGSVTDLAGKPFESLSGTATSNTAPNNASSWLPSKGNALGAGLALAPAALAAIQGPPKLPAAAQALQPSGAVSAPLIATENQQLAQGNAGTLTPSQQAGLDQTRQDAQNQLIQQLASSGVTDFKNDTRYIQGMQDINQKILAQQQQYVQQALTNGFTAAGQAAPALQTAATEQTANDTAYNDAVAKALEAAGSILGGQKAA